MDTIQHMIIVFKLKCLLFEIDCDCDCLLILYYGLLELYILSALINSCMQCACGRVNNSHFLFINFYYYFFFQFVKLYYISSKILLTIRICKSCKAKEVYANKVHRNKKKRFLYCYGLTNILNDLSFLSQFLLFGLLVFCF